MMQNLGGTSQPKFTRKLSEINAEGASPRRLNMGQSKVKSVQYNNLNTITINSLNSPVIHTLPDDLYSRESPTKQRLYTSNGTQSMQMRSPKLPSIFENDHLVNNSASSYKQRRLFSKNTVDIKKEKVPMSHFLFKSVTNAGFVPTKETLPTETSYDPTFDKIRVDTMESGSCGTLSFRFKAENKSFPFTSVLVRDQSKTPQEMLRTIENYGSTRKKNVINSPLEKKELCERLQTVSKFEKNEEFDGFFNKKFKINSDAATKYKKTIRTLEQKNRHLLVKKPTNEELIEKNKDKMLVYADYEGIDPSRPKFCFVARDIKKDYTGKPIKADVEFNIKLDEITKKLKLTSNYKYLYMLSGTPIFELAQIPRRENVIVISKEYELPTVEHIISNDLVRDFYEYGAKQNIEVYSKSRSRMDSILQGRKLIDDKFTEVLEVFDSENQLDSDQLQKLLEASKKMKNSEFKDTMQKYFGDQDYDYGELKNGPTHIPITTRSESGDTSQMGNSQMDGIITDRLHDHRNLEKGQINKVENYLQDPTPLCENEKLELYRDIYRFYKQSMKGKVLEFEEIDLDEVLKSLGIFEKGNDDADLDFEKQPESIRYKSMGRQLGYLLRRWARNNHKLDYQEIRQDLDRMLSRAGSMTRSRSRLAEALEINHFDENLIDMEAVKEEEEKKNLKRNFIKENKKTWDPKKSDIYKLEKHNKELFLKNIPKHIEDKNLSRRELHYVYTLYKALCEVTSQRHKEYHLGDGIDYHSFKNGIYQVFLQSDEVAKMIFYKIDVNFSGFLNWDEFINAMVIIQAKTVPEKIDLFIKLADEDGNGNLSKDEIFNLAKICLKKFVPNQSDGFLDDLCTYFTKLIFDAVNVDMNEEIPLASIKEAIISGNPESDLLAMFCGADI